MHLWCVSVSGDVRWLIKSLILKAARPALLVRQHSNIKFLNLLSVYFSHFIFTLNSQWGLNSRLWTCFIILLPIGFHWIKVSTLQNSAWSLVVSLPLQLKTCSEVVCFCVVAWSPAWCCCSGTSPCTNSCLLRYILQRSPANRKGKLVPFLQTNKASRLNRQAWHFPFTPSRSQHFDFPLPSPVRLFEMVVAPEQEYPLVCIGVSRGSSQSTPVHVEYINLNSNTSWFTNSGLGMFRD